MIYIVIALCALVTTFFACRYYATKILLVEHDIDKAIARKFESSGKAIELAKLREENAVMRNLLLDRDVARAIATTPDYVQSRHRRKKVEMLFAHLKRILWMARLRLRGPCGARDEFLLAATAQNLRRLAKLRPPHIAIAA